MVRYLDLNFTLLTCLKYLTDKGYSFFSFIFRKNIERSFSDNFIRIFPERAGECFIYIMVSTIPVEAEDGIT